MSDMLGQIADFYDADNRRLATEYERYAATPKGAIELAAAEATTCVSRLVLKARLSSVLTHEDVADLLGVTESRVSTVLASDGNLTVAALAKYLRAYGYRLDITAHPIEAGAAKAETCASCYEAIAPGEFVVDHEGREWPMHKQCGDDAGCRDGFESGPADYYPDHEGDFE